MKYTESYIQQLEFKILHKMLVHFGATKQKRTEQAKSYIYETPTIDVIKTKYTIEQLKKIIPILITLISKKEQLYIIAPNSYHIMQSSYFSTKFKHNFVTKWQNGLLTNYKELYNISPNLIVKRYPSAIFIIAEQQYNFLNKEVTKLNSLLTTQLIDTHMTQTRIIYRIPSNSKALNTKRFFIEINKQIITFAYIKEKFNLIQKITIS
jgi:ribosomal protein S2